MTRQARLVLDDCRGALEELTDGVHDARWRRRWVAAMVLLRAVGHVLDNVDSQRDPKMQAAIADAWMQLKRRKPEPTIFWQFIYDERNNVVKEYLVGAGHNITVYPGADRPADYQYVINTGPYKGRQQREVIAEAIKWWEQYLDAIDAAASHAP
ncbi:MAG: hypothetical protein K8H84_15110 [Sulfuricella denitrificans]|nr:hypothetical protein [Sulfuricella denitrificans]